MHKSLSEKQKYQLCKEMYCSGSGKAFPRSIFAETNTKVSRLTDHIYLHLDFLSIAFTSKRYFLIFFIEEYTKSGRAHRSMMPSAVDTAEGRAAPIIFDIESVSDTSDITIRLTDQIISIFLSIFTPLFYVSYNSYILLLSLIKVNIL